MKFFKNFLWMIIPVLIFILIIAVLLFLDSNRYINKTSILKNKKDIITCTQAEYSSEYKDNQLKINFTFFNINDKSLKLAKKMLKPNEGLIGFQLSDKNGENIYEIPIFLEDLNFIEAGKYSANKTIEIDKNIIKKARYTNYTYKIPICSLAKKESLSDKKTLIVYYSKGGNTKAVANEIKQLLQCDIAEIKSDEIYKQKIYGI